MALYRFMAVIGVRQNQDQNFAVVDLFDLEHAPQGADCVRTWLREVAGQSQGDDRPTERISGSNDPDPTGLQVLKKCRVSGRRHFCHPTSF